MWSAQMIQWLKAKVFLQYYLEVWNNLPTFAANIRTIQVTFLNLKLLRTMKKIIARMAMTAAVVTMCSYSFVSCSGGSGGMFGDVPGVAEKHAKEGIDLLTRLAESGTKEEIMDMLQNKSKQIDSIADAEIAAAIAALGDKEFPVEVDPGVPIKTLSDMKIVHDKCEKTRLVLKYRLNLPRKREYIRILIQVLQVC